MPAPSETVSCGSCGQRFAADALFCPACGTAKARNFEGDPLLGTRVGERFLLVERIGHGASGTIYLAEHVTLRRKVAVKVLHHELSRDDLAVERFRREATTVSEIDNEHIVQIHDFGRTGDGRLYLAMELLEGETLDNVLEREGQLPIEQAVDILIQLGDALIEAHAMGYVHRDLRPRNIYLAFRRGRANFVKLLDFGLAKLVEKEGEAASTSLGMTFGEPKYMSPEQARGEPVDRRADIYSLGCIVYEMLTGAPPFSSGKVFDILSRHVDTMPPPPSERRTDVPDWLDAAVMRMLAKKPEERFITVYRLNEALRQGLEHGTAMSGEIARRRETNPPASVSQAMAKLGKTELGRPALDIDEAESKSKKTRSKSKELARTAMGQAPGPKEDDGEQRRATGQIAAKKLGRDTAQNQPVDPTPVPGAVPGLLDVRDTERNSERIERELSRAEKSPWVAGAGDDAADDDDDLKKTMRREPSARGKRSSGGKSLQDAGTSSTGLSAAWYADGDRDDDEDLDASQQRKLERARAAISPAADEDDDDYFAPTRSRVPIIAGALGGLVLLIALIAYFWPSGGDGKQTVAAGATDEQPAETAAPTPPAADETPATDETPAPATDETPAVATKPVEEPAPKPAVKPDPKPDPKPVVRRDPKPKPKPDPPKPKPPVEKPPVEKPPVDNGSSKDKEQADFFAKMGQTSLRTGDILGAASSFNKALKLDPSNPTAVTGLGEIALSQGSYAAAVTHLKKASRLRSGSARVWTLLGDAYLGAGNNTAAAAAFKKALKINPDNPQARDGYNEATGAPY